jgi:hypothetical protein
MSKKRTIHTTKHKDGGWQNKGGGDSKASGRFETKAEAQAAGREIAKNQNAEHVIHGKDGKIQNSNSYGNDPFPPRDKR